MDKKNGFKNLSNKLIIQTKFNNFILSNTDQSVAIDKIMVFCKKYLLFCLYSLESYERGEIKMQRVIGISLVRFMILLTAIRFFIASLSHQKWIIILMSDANDLLGNRSLISIMLCMAATIVLSIGLVLQIQELSRSLKLLDFLIGYKRMTIIPLNPINTRGLALKTNLMTKYFISQAFWPLVILTFGLLSSSTLLAYLDPTTGFLAVGLIVWNLFLFAFITQMYALVCIGLVVWTLSSLYLKYKFNEISDRIDFSLKIKSRPLLMNAIKEHHLISKQTEDLNEFFCLMIFIVYYFASPTLMILLYLIHAKDSVLFLRYVALFVFCIVFMALFIMNLFSSLISGSAQKSRKYFYRYLFKNHYTSVDRLKILAFIEKLSGPDIGFYCWNLFPMNNNQFFKNVVNCAATYFLIMDLI